MLAPSWATWIRACGRDAPLLIYNPLRMPHDRKSGVNFASPIAKWQPLVERSRNESRSSCD
jgi:hypothetical protein